LGEFCCYYPTLPIRSGVSIRTFLSEAIYLSKESGTAEECSNILLGLVRSQANWNDLEERACEGVVERMRRTISEFGNQVYRYKL
jgi:hypothetical protein